MVKTPLFNEIAEAHAVFHNLLYFSASPKLLLHHLPSGSRRETLLSESQIRTCLSNYKPAPAHTSHIKSLQYVGAGGDRKVEGSRRLEAHQ